MTSPDKCVFRCPARKHRHPYFPPTRPHCQWAIRTLAENIRHGESACPLWPPSCLRNPERQSLPPPVLSSWTSESCANTGQISTLHTLQLSMPASGGKDIRRNGKTHARRQSDCSAMRWMGGGFHNRSPQEQNPGVLTLLAEMWLCGLPEGTQPSDSPIWVPLRDPPTRSVPRVT